MEIFELTSNTAVVRSESGDRAFVNTGWGRAELESQCPPEIVAQVYEVWGGETTYIEPVRNIPVSTQPSIDERLAAAEELLLFMMGVI